MQDLALRIDIRVRHVDFVAPICLLLADHVHLEQLLGAVVVANWIHLLSARDKGSSQGVLLRFEVLLLLFWAVVGVFQD